MRSKTERGFISVQLSLKLELFDAVSCSIAVGSLEMIIIQLGIMTVLTLIATESKTHHALHN